MFANKNNLRSELTANIGDSDTSISITSGEGILWENDMVACLEHYENDVCTKREIIKITAKNNDTFTVTRGFAVCIMNDETKQQGQGSQTFAVGDFLSVYLSKELRESITQNIGINETALQTMVGNITAPRTCINNNCLSWKQSIDSAYNTKYGGIAGFGDASDGDCVITTNDLDDHGYFYFDASCEYNFNNLTICEGVVVRFEGVGVPTINVWNDFKNFGIIDLRAGYVPNGSQTDCRLEQGCTICNLNSDIGLNCGGSGGSGATYSEGRVGCPGLVGCPGSLNVGGNGGAGGDGYTGGTGCPGGSADGCNGGNGGRGGNNPNSYAGGGGGGGGGGAGKYGKGGNGGCGGIGDAGIHAHGVGGNGGNSGLFGIGGNGGEGGSDGNNGAGNGGNGYCGGTGGLGGTCGDAGNGGIGVVKGGTGGESFGRYKAGDGGNAVTNVYGFHLNARNIYNNCVNSRGGDGGQGGKAECGTSGNGGNGADGGQMIISYENIYEQGCFDVSAGCGGKPGNVRCPECGTCGVQGNPGNNGRLVLKTSRSPFVQNFTLENDAENESILISWKDPRVISRNKTMIRYSTVDYPSNINDGTLAVEETTRDQYFSTPYSLTGVSDQTTYYFTAFALDSDNNIIDTETATITTQWGRTPGANTVAYFPMSSNLTDVISSNNLTGNCTFGTIGGSTINCAITTSNGLSGTGSNLPQGNNPRTVSVWFYFDGSNTNEGGTVFYGTGGGNNKVFGAYSEINGGNWELSLSQRGANSGYLYTRTTGSWYLITMTYDSNHVWKLYINGTYIGQWSYNIGTTGNDILLGSLVWNPGDYLYGGFSNLIIENVEWTAQEISDYYDQTKGNYGIS